jgi:outer membrane protein
LPDKLQAQTALAQARLEHSRAMSQWFTARGELAVAMGLPAERAIEFAAVDNEPEALPANAIDTRALIDEARANHPRIVAARARLAEAQARASAVGAESWGSVAVSAKSGRTRSSADTPVRSNSSASVEWTLPLFDRASLRSRLGDAQGQIQVRNAGVADALSQVELLVWQQAQALRGQRDALEESLSVLDSAEAALRVAGERFRQGVGGFADVLSAQNAAANSRFQWVEARANLRRAQWRLAAAVGRFGPLR